MHKQTAGDCVVLGLAALALGGVVYMHYLLWRVVLRLESRVIGYHVTQGMEFSLKCLFAEAIALLAYLIFFRPRIGSAQLVLALLIGSVAGLVLFAYAAFWQVVAELPVM